MDGVGIVERKIMKLNLPEGGLKLAYIAGIKPGEERPSGWWEGMVGPGRAIDTDVCHFVCANVLGGCGGGMM